MDKICVRLQVNLLETNIQNQLSETSLPGLVLATTYFYLRGFPGSSAVKNACSTGDSEDIGWIPESRRSPEEGNGNLPQYLCQESSMNRGAWQTTVCGVTKSQTRLSTRTHTHFCLQQQIIVFVTLKHSNLLPTHQGLSVMSHLLSEDINGSFLVNSQYLTIKLGKPLTSAAFSSHSTHPSPSSRKPLTIPPSHECL